MSQDYVTPDQPTKARPIPPVPRSRRPQLTGDGIVTPTRRRLIFSNN